MFRKFECKSCGVTFTADDTNLVECPHCKSDDVAPLRERNNNLFIALCAAGALVLAAGITIGLKGCSSDGEQVVTYEEVGEEVETFDSTRVEKPTVEIVLGPLKVSAPVADKASKTYSITVATQREPVGKLKYYLTDYATGVKKEYKADKGVIKGIKPASDTAGSYILHVDELKSDGSINDSAESELTGFVKFPEAAIAKLSRAEVQQHVNGILSGSVNPASLINSGRYSPTVTVEISGVGPCGLREIEVNARFKGWSGFTVSNVEYTENGQVSQVFLTPINE